MRRARKDSSVFLLQGRGKAVSQGFERDGEGMEKGNASSTENISYQKHEMEFFLNLYRKVN